MEELIKSVSELRYALDTFYLLISGVLVMWMAAGFSMLEAGLVRAKNTTEILTKNILLYAIACIMFLLVGYNIMYVDNAAGGWLPSFGSLIGTQADDAGHSLHSDFFFQVVFVATATSIVSGAVAERMKLWSFLLFCVVMTGVIYPMEGYWTWGGGFLKEAGFSDFAGSGIVHLAGAAAALAAVLLLGARRGKYGKQGEIYPIPGSNLPLATLGTLILWMGWFGFNGGSQLVLSTAADATAIGTVFVNTNAAAAAGVVGALLVSKLTWGKADLTMILNGALGALVVYAIVAFDRLKIDDPVGAISVHGVCGLFGLMVVPLSNESATFSAQLLGAAVIFGWVFGASLIVWGLLKATMGLRVSEEEEMMGVDVHECGIDAYPEFVTVKSSI
ncbi:ammonium transporter [Aeromonas salmonicida subsp. salmonicida]|uniref:Ammonium transporter n=1 Tax=Aeromonas salmonicida subsp. salmonicida 01-B526 TaxID=1076135 RepID=A0ABN0DYQ8_AERSS|nr:ammonium transporter [Aeromonas salmonicida]AYO64925.1 ammonium transporter [Aeromonas salmonicida subsp. salmonicida 01-B526]EHI52037.1 ammonium transporter [Aeromonas salmonicida subsp. salmonicida 01-B526]EKP0240840.1 ammonium transporter [Aeromonas salmonicida]EKP0245085.1 ammonium transporter [Aeromonas salmonicida]EKP0257771.1 ammonium transporter [Aeromonas salmonicida]